MEEKLIGILEEYRENEGNLITLLQDIQAKFGYVPEEAVQWFSRELDVPESRFYGISTFYSQFYLKPRGRNIITACCGTACHVKGSERLINAALRELQLHDDQDTTPDGEITFEKVACLGTCSMAPVMVINKKMFAKMTPEKLKKEIKSFVKSSK
ncbi:MAG: NAD(P)H-dependent oxidoreductase subunit E [Thermodesulfovibrionales bacterium]